MLLPWDLEDWLTDEGGRVVTAMDRGEPLLPNDPLLREVWLFDTEERNGGIEQYFFNRPEHWSVLCALATPSLPSFGAFARLVDSVIRGAEDPCEAIAASDVDFDEAYDSVKVAVVTELRAFIGRGASNG